MATRDPGQVAAYGSQFMRENGLSPSIPIHSNPNQMNSAYQSETGHQAYKPTENHVSNVRGQGSSAFNNDLSKRGESMRAESSLSIYENSQNISQEEHSVGKGGASIENKVASEQGRNVTTRVVEKVLKEGGDTVSDLKKAWNNTGNDLSKIRGGEPQQK